VPRAENAELYRRYEALAEATGNVTFVGRLATYKYYNMDQVVGQALAAFKRLQKKHQEAASAARDALPLAAVAADAAGA
jgi:UDP-galactopyranose mutase